ncbi:MAG: hypothetical protein J5917_05815 [Bacteroidales bacterium]|nr:hypothetical protein [Bacteroidales bacterium]MBP3235616.1 hypothetical protein [Bacteroidales bacterium]
MIADTLMNWDKTELANILADKMADADDLVEAFPAIEKASNIEESILEDFIQSNWKLILSGFDVDELLEWIEEKDYEEKWERWKNECIEEDYEYAEYRNEEYCWALIDFFFSLRNMDLAEQRGYPSKFRKS